ncbi:PaaI family thioesterase [Corynebacterium mendelii]|uniref:PaaI family thioesterase n=1 Tax=Corynebacterium mendelii TaxID=2765362 RepID=A0A939DYG7_9CORY|nr:PaaI family thioesterase [Corynebacterium mendelii]MBN9643555.1 PaaI family thioesterase [Corynebacterium mendelii]
MDSDTKLWTFLARAHNQALSAAERAELNGLLTGLDAALGTTVTHLGPNQVEMSLTVTGDHLQPRGCVHGGVFASLVETAGSLMACVATGKKVVGTTNSTQLLKPVREGQLHVTATPVHTGRTTQLVEVTITDGSDSFLAVGQLRTLAAPER